MRITLPMRQKRTSLKQRFWTGIAGICAISAVMMLTTICLSESGSEHFSTWQDATIRIQPSGAFLQLPRDWRTYLTRKEIEGVKKGKGEWQAEYANVMNAALPFPGCSLHAGQFGWDQGAFLTLQMRAYVFNSDIGAVQKRIEANGFSAAKHLSSKNISKVALTETDLGQWHRILIAYDVSYGDYGGRANIEFYLSSHESWTIALVFMHVDSQKNASAVENILRSFSWTAG